MNFNLAIKPKSITNQQFRFLGKAPNYRDDQNGVGPDDEPIEADEKSGRKDKLVVCDGVPFEEQSGDEEYTDKADESNESRPVKEYEMIILDDEDSELPPESSTMTSTNLTVVYDVEYRAPDGSD